MFLDFIPNTQKNEKKSFVCRVGFEPMPGRDLGFKVQLAIHCATEADSQSICKFISIIKSKFKERGQLKTCRSFKDMRLGEAKKPRGHKKNGVLKCPYCHYSYIS